MNSGFNEKSGKATVEFRGLSPADLQKQAEGIVSSGDKLPEGGDFDIIKENTKVQREANAQAKKFHDDDSKDAEKWNTRNYLIASVSTVSSLLALIVTILTIIDISPIVSIILKGVIMIVLLAVVSLVVILLAVAFQNKSSERKAKQNSELPSAQKQRVSQPEQKQTPTYQAAVNPYPTPTQKYAPPSAQSQTAQENGLATASLVFGIASVFFLFFIPVLALFLAFAAIIAGEMAAVKRGGYTGMTKAGIALGGLGLVASMITITIMTANGQPLSQENIKELIDTIVAMFSRTA